MSGQLLINVFNKDHISGEREYHAGGDAANCLDGNTYTAWKPNSVNRWAEITFDLLGPVSLNFIALTGIKIDSDMDRIYLTGSDDAEFTSPVRIAEILLSDLIAGLYVNISSNITEYRYYRITLTNYTENQNQAEFSGILMGNALSLPHGIAAPYTPPKLSTKSEVTNNKTMGGHFVGRSVLTGQYDFIIKNKNLTPEWINANWQGIHDQILTKPFMYLWDDSKPEDAVFCWTKSDIPAPKYDNQCYFSFSIPCNGFIENA